MHTCNVVSMGAFSIAALVVSVFADTVYVAIMIAVLAVLMAAQAVQIAHKKWHWCLLVCTTFTSACIIFTAAVVDIGHKDRMICVGVFAATQVVNVCVDCDTVCKHDDVDVFEEIS